MALGPVCMLFGRRARRCLLPWHIQVPFKTFPIHKSQSHIQDFQVLFNTFSLHSDRSACEEAHIAMAHPSPSKYFCTSPAIKILLHFTGNQMAKRISLNHPASMSRLRTAGRVKQPQSVRAFRRPVEQGLRGRTELYARSVPKILPHWLAKADRTLCGLSTSVRILYISPKHRHVRISIHCSSSRDRGLSVLSADGWIRLPLLQGASFFKSVIT